VPVCDGGAPSRRKSRIALAGGNDGDAACGEHGAQPDGKREHQVFLVQMLCKMSPGIRATVCSIQNDEELRLHAGSGSSRQRRRRLRWLL